MQSNSNLSVVGSFPLKFEELLDLKNDMLLDLEAAVVDVRDPELEFDIRETYLRRIPHLASEAAVLERQIGMMRLRGGNKEKAVLNFISRAHLLMEINDRPSALLSLRWAKRLSPDPDVIKYVENLIVEYASLDDPTFIKVPERVKITEYALAPTA